jgi:hypothetical protein
VALVAASLVLGLTPVAAAQYDTVPPPPGGTFLDDDQIPEEGYIEAIAAAGITVGCNSANDQFCPDRTITRAEMATMLVRALGLAASADDRFADDNGLVHEDAINALAAAGITAGCNAPANDRFCPDQPLTRGEMATFLVRAFGYSGDAEIDRFVDDDGLAHEQAINALAAAGVTVGCDTDRFCPWGALPRRQMAVFLTRALSLNPLVPEPRSTPPYPDVGDGKRIVYSNSEQRVWLIDEREQLIDTYPVSGREAVPATGTYQVFSKSVEARATSGGITMRHMVRFAHGPRVPYGFHSIPRGSDGQPLQTEEELGQFRSGGCVRQADAKAEALYAWAPIGTTVILLR